MVAALGVAGIAIAVALAGRSAKTEAPPPAAPRESPSAPAPSPPASSAELALVAPLVAGSDLAGFTVREIQGVRNGRLRVVCVKSKARVGLEVALVDPDGAAPPASAGRYGIYYTLRGATPEEGERLALALARVIQVNADAGAPLGLAPFVPDPKPGTAL
jgi:hypothetical protein